MLSRFDLILVLRDTKDPVWDRMVARHILDDDHDIGGGGGGGGGGDVHDQTPSQAPVLFSFLLFLRPVSSFRELTWNGRGTGQASGADGVGVGVGVGFWTTQRLRSYFTHIKQLKPRLTDEADRLLSQYYARQRRSEQRNAARTTVRMLESMIRSDRHCKMSSFCFSFLFAFRFLHWQVFFFTKVKRNSLFLQSLRFSSSF